MYHGLLHESIPSCASKLGNAEETRFVVTSEYRCNGVIDCQLCWQWKASECEFSGRKRAELLSWHVGPGKRHAAQPHSLVWGWRWSSSSSSLAQAKGRGGPRSSGSYWGQATMVRLRFASSVFHYVFLILPLFLYWIWASLTSCEWNYITHKLKEDVTWISSFKHGQIECPCFYANCWSVTNPEKTCKISKRYTCNLLEILLLPVSCQKQQGGWKENASKVTFLSASCLGSIRHWNCYRTVLFYNFT